MFIITFPAKSLFIYGLIAAIYFLYCYPLLRLATWLEKRLTGGLQGAGLN